MGAKDEPATRPLGAWLQERRKERGLTIDALSRAAAVASGALSRIEAGKVDPALVTVVRVCRVLDIALDDLVAAQDRHTPQNPTGHDETSREGGAILTRADLDAALDEDERDRVASRARLAAALTDLDEAYAATGARGAPGLRYTPASVDALLGDVDGLIALDLRYPRDLSPTRVLAILASGGVVGAADARHVSARRASDAAPEARHTVASTLRHLAATTIDHVSLADVLEADTALAPDAAIARLWWDAAALWEDLGRVVQDDWRDGASYGPPRRDRRTRLALAKLVIVIDRWQRHLASLSTIRAS